MYQPIVVMPGNIMVIAPILFVGSRPERNLLSVVSSKTDFEHSKEVNDLENLMVEEIEEILKNHSNLVIVKHKNLEGRLPDIDLGVYEPNSNAVLLAQNEKHRKEIQKLNHAAEQVAKWADKNERTKIGFDPIKEHDRCLSTRSFIGAKTKKMQRRVKQMENELKERLRKRRVF